MTVMRRPPPPLSRVLARVGVLSLMGTSVAFGLWPLASALLAGLVLSESLARFGVADPLARLARRGFPDLDASGLGRRWSTVLHEARRVSQTRQPGLQALVQRTWRSLSGTSASVARAVPFLLLGTVGSVIVGQVGLATLLVAAYPFLEIARYHEALRRIRQSA